MPWVFVLPALGLYGVFLLYPTGAGFFYAFTNWDGFAASPHLTGLANFRHMLNDPVAKGALEHTFLLAAAIVIVQNAFGLTLALALQHGVKTRSILRSLLLLPACLSPFMVALLWQYLYSPTGVINQLLGDIGLHSLERAWLGDINLVLWAIAATVVWQFLGYSMIIFTAGLRGIPEELYAASAVDGAGRWRQFKDITFPLLAPALTVNLTLSLIGSLKLFDQVIAMTNGGPGYSTETLATQMYKQAFIYGNFGYGTALALVLTVIVAAAAIIQVSVLRRRELART